MNEVWRCLFSPRLYKIYKNGPLESMYEPNGLERWSDKLISTTNTLINIALYTSPFVGTYLFRRGFFSEDEARVMIRSFGGLGFMFGVCCLLRAVGRAANPQYTAFVRALSLPTRTQQERLRAIRCYDFDYNAWPVSFAVNARTPESWYLGLPFMNSGNPELPVYQRLTIQILAYLATHTFGLRIIYPGSLGLINYCLSSALFEGRAHLVEDFDGKRAKIQTADRNTIDTLFVDNRGKHPTKGGILVVCCEGNSGFYEIGIMTTPAKAGYSVLGWNHPGFGGSSGRPYPNQEHNAIDALMQYAIQELGFKPEEIVMYGWSIGGYSAAWAAVNYPVRGLLLDATFDDLLPLAENQMPASWKLLVHEVVRSYVNLNVADLVANYTGPVQIVRRTDDEIICVRAGDLSTNRGNYLLVKLVELRHSDIDQETREEVRRLVALRESQRDSLLVTTDNQRQIKASGLISAYMRDYKSSHCTPLPEKHFEAAMKAMDSARSN